MSLSDPGLPLKLNFADPDTGTELTAYVAHAPTEIPDPKTGMITPDGPDRILEVEELIDAHTGEPVAITTSIRAQIDKTFDAAVRAQPASLRDAIDLQHGI